MFIQHGEPSRTVFALSQAQLVAERLGVPISQVQIVHGDTDKVQFGMGTYGSRSLAVGGSAIVKAMDKVEAKAKKIASHLLEASESDPERLRIGMPMELTLLSLWPGRDGSPVVTYAFQPPGESQ